MPSQSQIDSTVRVVTPENIAFEYTVAGPFRRLPALLIDTLVRGAIFVAFFLLLAFSAVTTSAGIFTATTLIVWFALDWFYGGLLETFLNGQTPGKWVMGIRVLTVRGQPINGMQAILRNVLRAVDFFPLLSLEIFGAPVAAYVIPTFTMALGTMTMNSRFQRVGDLVAGTIVVVEERHWLTGVATLEDERVPRLAGLIPADFPVSRSLAVALSAYVERRRFFSAARRKEIAKHLAEPLITEFGFPPDTGYDLLLCALYFRVFIADRAQEEALVPAGTSPFGTTGVTWLNELSQHNT